jgi:DNA-binding transcriptional MerR regulator
MEEGLLSIGSFAILSGMSIPALRHYDEVGVLKPRHVDSRTNYRYYHPSQVRPARMIRALRAIDLPVDEIKDVIEAEDDEYVRTVLADHRDRLASRAQVLSEQLQAVDEFIERGVTVPEVKGNRIVMLNLPVHDAEVAKKFYEDALDVEFQVDSHAEDDPGHYAGTFGAGGTDSFFLMQLWVTKDHAGSANFGFTCEDLDATYKKALAAGATDLHAPMDKPGMPRNAYVKDPSGNILGLYQG